MKLTKGELLRLQQEHTARPMRQRAMCPPSEELVLVAAGEANKAEQARVYDHLIGCAECAAEFRTILPLESWAAQVTTNVDAPVPQISMTMPASSMEGTQAKKSNAPRAWWRKFVLPLRQPVFSAAVAALFLIATITLGWLTLSLRQENQRLLTAVNKEAAVKTQASQSLEEVRRQLEESNRRATQSETQLAEQRLQIEKLSQPQASLSQPQVNVSIVDLEPRGANRSTAAPVKQVEVPASANVFTCILNVTGQLSFPNYELEIVDQSGTTVWRGEGLTKSAQNTFMLVLPQALLPAGKYQFMLSGLRGRKRELIEEYTVQLQYK